jgi:small ligand-binding sensory domain FIST
MSISETRTGLRFASSLSTKSDSAAAVAEVCDQSQAMIDAGVGLAFAFVSRHHGPDFAPLAQAICDRIGTDSLLGCSAESIVGGEREVEGGPAIALWLARMPDVSVRLMHLEYQETVEDGTFLGWPDEMQLEWPAGSALLVLGDPYSFPADEFLARMNEDRPGVPVVGGMASGAMAPRENRLFLGRRELSSGAVAAFVHGAVRIRSVVSQGCKPIGEHYVITRANRNVIQELSGKPPLAQLQQLFPKLPAADQMRIQQGLHIGRVINEYQDRFERGDFLVRNVINADPGSGAIAIGELVRPGQTVQFHVRDAKSADEDLRQLITNARSESSAAPLAALLFTCNGRGRRLFMQPNHDAAVLRSICGEIPAAGFFAAGEIGPIGGKNFVHGFTASVALFEGTEHA